MNAPAAAPMALGLALMAVLLAAALDVPFAAPAPESGVAGAHRSSLPLTYEDRPVTLRASMLAGSILVQGDETTEVRIETTIGEGDEPGVEPGDPQRVTVANPGVRATEHENLVVLELPWRGGVGRTVVTVPRRTSMKLECVRACTIEVRDVEGELELNSSDGPVTATGIRGSVVATAINGDLTVAFDRMDPDKAMSFVTFNGDADVTFPAGLSADLRLSQALGERFIDFDLKVTREGRRMDTERGGARRDLKAVDELEATVGGGGAEIRFQTWRGDIHLRRAPGGS